jgi:predicted transcriptional regulator of viral defense system
VDKNIYKTPREQRLLDLISSHDTVKVDEIAGLMAETDAVQIKKMCHSLSKKGYLHRVRKGIYLVSEKPSDSPVIKNPYEIALTLFSGYIGFSSALRLYDLLDYEPFTIFVVTTNKSREYNLGEYTFKSVAMGDKATGMAFYNGLYVSTPAKTFFDCFYKPQYAGGYAEITKALYQAKEIDWREFVSYFDHASDALCQRTGHVLDMFDRDTGKVPDHVLAYLRARRKNKTPLLPSGGGKETYNPDWMVMDNLGKENIMSWWQHG